MKKTIYLVIGMICLCGSLFGCGKKQEGTVTNEEPPIQSSISDTEEGSLNNNASVAESENKTENSNVVNAEEVKDTFGILISLPENSNWVTDVEYSLEDENHLTITYHDSIADSDCTLLVAKNENLNLPSDEYDETLNESWEGKTLGNQLIAVKVQHKKNEEKAVLATWEYNEYQFAIMGEDENDSKSIPKAALEIIYNLD